MYMCVLGVSISPLYTIIWLDFEPVLTMWYYCFSFLSVLFLFQTKLPSRPSVSRGTPLTQQQWSKHMDSDGKIKDIDKLKDVIFRGVSKGR